MIRRYKRRSRLFRKEGQRYIRQSAVFVVLTILLAIAVLFWGIPSLIKLAIFLGELRGSRETVSGEDMIPPPPPILQPLSDSTNSATLRIEGFAEEGSIVILTINGRQVSETITESDGEFLFDTVALAEGDNTVSAQAVDNSGNQSQPSSSLRVNLDRTPPSLTLTEPMPGSTFVGPSEQDIVIRGSSEPGVTLTLNGMFVILSQTGEFSTRLRLTEGENTIVVTARDRAGNETNQEQVVNFIP